MAIIDVVKYNGGDRVYAWKFPNESLSTRTQLIVNDSQEAVLFKDGIALDVFASGRYVLDTENVPLLTGMIRLPFGGRSPFSAEVWFINKAHSLDIKWGTATPVQIQDPRYGIFVPLRSFGQFGIRIIDSKKFLVKLVGTMPVFDKENLVQYFRGFYLTRIKDALSSYLIHKKVSILEINAYLEEISQYLQERIKPDFDEYGIELINFFINDVSVSEDDPALRKLKNALAKKAEMTIIGWELAGYCPACNKPVFIGGAKYCPECGSSLGQICHSCQKPLAAGSKFCPHCGQAVEEP